MKTKFFLISVIVILIFACQNKLQVNNIPENFESQIDSLLYSQTNEWNKGNIDGFMCGYWQSDSLKFITSKGITYSFNAVRDNYKKTYSTPERMGVLNFKELKHTSLSEQLVNTTGKWQVLRNTDTLSGNFSLIIKYFNPHWRIIIDHTW